VTSGITLLEVLVRPYRLGNLALPARYDAVLTDSVGIELVLLAPRLLRAAASLRAETGVKTPDALKASPSR